MLLSLLLLTALFGAALGATLQLDCATTPTTFSFRDGSCVDISSFASARSSGSYAMVRPTCTADGRVTIEDCVTAAYSYRTPLRVPHPPYNSVTIDNLSCISYVQFTYWIISYKLELYSNMSSYMSVDCNGASPTQATTPSGLYPYIPTPAPTTAFLTTPTPTPTNNTTKANATTSEPSEFRDLTEDQYKLILGILVSVLVVVFVVVMCCVIRRIRAISI